MGGGVRITLGRYEWSAQLPQVGRLRAIVTCALAAVFMTMWFWALLKGLAGMRPSMRTVVAGVGVPWGWAWSSLLYAEYQLKRELKPEERLPMPEHDEPERAGAR
jgi:hypothetical protein